MRESWRLTTGKLLNRHVLVITLLLLHCAMAMSAVRQKSATFDELPHLTAGYSYWTLNDFRLHPENGALPQRWASLPLLPDEPRFPSLDTRYWQESDVWNIGYRFFYTLGNDTYAMLLKGRAMVAVLSAVLGLLVYIWSRSLFGNLGGTLSLVLYAFSPTMLAHGSLITSDLTAALGFTAATWLVWRQFQRLTPGSVLSSAVVMGLLFLSKLSAILIIPIAGILLLIRLARSAPLPVRLRGWHEIRSRRGQLLALSGSALAHVFVVLMVIWANYGFQYSAFRAGVKGEEKFLGERDNGSSRHGTVQNALQLAKDQKVLPEAYLEGFSYVIRKSRRAAFLNGAHSETGWWHFFPYTFLVKSPIPLLVVLFLAVCAIGAQHHRKPPGHPQVPRSRRDLAYAISPLVVLLCVYWAAALSSPLNIGHRHLLPTYPALFILAGAASVWITRRRPWPALVLVGALIVFIAESLAIWPHYLAYFNVLAGGPKHAYRHLVDSSLDWGQDLPSVKRWLAHQAPDMPPKMRVYFSYFGVAEPTHHGISTTRLPGYPLTLSDEKEIQALTGGLYLISATSLQSIYNEVPGPWTEEIEEFYQTLGTKIHLYLESRNSMASETAAAKRGESIPEEFRPAFRRFNSLRFARLLSYLRKREPDDQIGYSVLVYRLTDEDVFRALYGRPIFG